MPHRKPRLGVWKFASCDGCQLSLLDCEDELLAIAGALDIAYFPEATRGEVKGVYDLSLVEGSITTPHDAERIHDVRARSKTLITIGACATSGGIQALRNFADVRDRLRPSGIYPDARDLDRDLAACPRRFRVARLPDQQGPTGRCDLGVPHGPSPQYAGGKRLRAMQAQGQCLRHGRAGDPLPRPRYACRLRRLMSVL